MGVTYYSCSVSKITRTFGTIEEKQSYTDEINEINYDPKMDYFLVVFEDDKKKNKKDESTDLELSKLFKIEKIDSLKIYDQRTFKSYKTNPSFNPSQFIIAYKLKGVRTLDLVPMDSEEYFDEEFLAKKIHSLIVNGEMRVSELTLLECISKARDLEKNAEAMTKIQGDYDEKKTNDMYGMCSAVIDFVKALNFKEQYRRFRDIALFIYRKDSKIREQEAAKPEIEHAELKPIVEPDKPIDKIGTYIQQGFPGISENCSVKKFTKAGKLAKKQEN